YILKGELNTEKYQEEIHENFSVNNVEEDIAYILKNFFLYNEEKFLSVLKSAVDIIKEGEYAFGYRLNIYMKIKELSKKNIVSYSKNQLDDLEKAHLKKYELQISNSISGEDILDLKDFHFDPKLNLNNYKKELSRKMKDLQDKYLDEKGINHQYIQSILNEDRKTRSELEMEYREIEREDIFKLFNQYIKYIEEELLKNNSKIIYLNRYIYNKNGMFIQSSDDIEIFIEHIERIKVKAKDKIANYNFSLLEKTLINIRENFLIDINK